MSVVYPFFPVFGPARKTGALPKQALVHLGINSYAESALPL
jgi:hypothetical protein